MVRQGPPGTTCCNIEVGLPLDTPTKLWEGDGLIITARRFRHKDFRLFPGLGTAH
jgi:hypothetical protein